MTSSPHETLRESSEAIVESVFRRLSGSSALHYNTADKALLRERCETLVQVLLESTAGHPRALAVYIREITRERISEGYHLHEVHLALTLLEKKAWEVCEKAIPDRDPLVKALALLTGVIGDAKDEVARVFVEHHERIANRAA
jgi:hypothetical protein